MRNNRNALISIILVICLVTMMMTILASADANLSVSAKSAAVYEPKTRTFPFSKDMTHRMPMASTTKIMTGLIAIEHGGFDDVVRVPSDAVGVEGSSVYLKEGDTLTMRDLIYSLMLQSANDAATAIAILISGDVPSFAEKMNERARELGLSDTNYDNPHGLDSDTHYTTAKDLALLTAAALENETFKEVVSTYKYTFSTSSGTRTVVNHNKLLKRYSGTIGVKTGYTKISGRCLVSAAEKDGIRLIAVTLNASDDWCDHTNMLNAAFPMYERVDISSLVEEDYKIPVINSKTTAISAKLEYTTSPFVIKSKFSDDITAKIDIKQYLSAPVKEGDKVGEVIIYSGDEIIERLNITANESADTEKKKIDIFGIFSRGRQTWKKLDFKNS